MSLNRPARPYYFLHLVALTFLPALSARPAVDPANQPSDFAQSFAGVQPPNAEESDKYVISIKQIAKFVVGLGDKVAPTDVEEGMRVG